MSLKSRQTLAEQIAQYLGHRIITGELKAGERVKELELAKKLDVSTNTVREAMLLLEKRHLLEIVPRRGAMVAALTKEQVRSLYRLLALMMSEVVRNIARTWERDDLKPFVEKMAILQQRTQQGDVEGFHHHGIDFVETSFKYADNCYMESLLGDLLPVLRRCTYLALVSEKAEVARSYSFFQQMMSSVLKRDEQRSIDALQSYLEHQCSLVLAAQGAANEAVEKEAVVS